MQSEKEVKLPLEVEAKPMAEVVPLSRGELRLTYRIPAAMQPLLPGTLVIVPLQGRREKAVVVGLTDVCDFPESKLLNISGPLSEGSVLPPDLLRLGTWISAYYMAPFRTVVEAMVPAPVREGKAQLRETMIEAIRPIEESTREALRKSARRQSELLEFL
ncbi:MAG: hypothetical protein ACQKBT_00415, partial [Puniceicoccales bacterium]